MNTTTSRKKLMIPALVLLVLGVILGLRFTVKHLGEMENQTPIPPGPKLTQQVSEPVDYSKIETYEKEIEDNKHAIYKKEPDLQAVSIPWDKVFAKDNEMLAMEQSDDTRTDVSPSDSVVNNKSNTLNNKMKPGNNKLTTKKDRNNLTDQQVTPGFHTVKSKNSTSTVEVSDNSNRLIVAVVNGDQKISNNQSVTFRVIEAIEIADIQLARNTLIYGKARVAGNRLTIETERIKTTDGVIPLTLHGLDKDLMEGLIIENNELSSAAQSIGGEIVDDLTVYEYNGIIRSIKSAFRRKKDRSLWLVDGYQVYFEYRPNN